MRRRSRAGGESAKAQRRKTGARKSGISQKAGRPRSPSIASLEAKVARLTSELKEALEQKKAASEVLQVISGSAADLQAVFGTLLETAMYLCGSNIAAIWRSDGKAFKLAASRGVSTKFEKFATENPITPGRGTITGRTALGGKTVHVPDVLADRDFVTDYQSRANYRSALGVPLLRQGETIGVFTLTRSNVQPYTESQIEGEHEEQRADPSGHLTQSSPRTFSRGRRTVASAREKRSRLPVPVTNWSKYNSYVMSA